MQSVLTVLATTVYKILFMTWAYYHNILLAVKTPISAFELIIKPLTLDQVSLQAEET